MIEKDPEPAKHEKYFGAPQSSLLPLLVLKSGSPIPSCREGPSIVDSKQNVVVSIGSNDEFYILFNQRRMNARPSAQRRNNLLEQMMRWLLVFSYTSVTAFIIETNICAPKTMPSTRHTVGHSGDLIEISYKQNKIPL